MTWKFTGILAVPDRMKAFTTKSINRRYNESPYEFQRTNTFLENST
jgi:hypothetical protein